MTRNTFAVLSRVLRVRDLIHREQQRATPDTLRLMRLKGLALRLRQRLDALALGLAGPRLVPVRVAAR